MRLVSFDGGFGRVEGDAVVPMGTDLAGYLRTGHTADGEPWPLAGLALRAPVARPEKIICVGLNNRDHAAESGSALPDEPVDRMLEAEAPWLPQSITERSARKAGRRGLVDHEVIRHVTTRGSAPVLSSEIAASGGNVSPCARPSQDLAGYLVDVEHEPITLAQQACRSLTGSGRYMRQG